MIQALAVMHVMITDGCLDLADPPLGPGKHYKSNVLAKI